MNPEKLTVSQIIGALTVKQLAALITGVCALLYGAYWLAARLQQADLMATNSQIQTKLERAEAEVKSLSSANAEQKQFVEKIQTRLEQFVEESQSQLEQKDQEVARLSAELGRSSNCAFIHHEILATKKEMEGTGSMVAFDASREWAEKQRLRQVGLGQRLEAYQQQLGSCNK